MKTANKHMKMYQIIRKLHTETTVWCVTPSEVTKISKTQKSIDDYLEKLGSLLSITVKVYRCVTSWDSNLVGPQKIQLLPLTQKCHSCLPLSVCLISLSL